MGVVPLRLSAALTALVLAVAAAGCGEEPPPPSGSVHGATQRLTVAADGSQSNNNSYYGNVSGDGRFVVFSSTADNLVPDDTNGVVDVFLWERATGALSRISVAPDGSEGNDQSYQPSISADGRYVAFTSRSTNFAPGKTSLRLDVFVLDRQSGMVELASVTEAGVNGNGDSLDPMISADGRQVVFMSGASDLVPGDTNSTFDIFVRNLDTGATQRVSMASSDFTSEESNDWSYGPSISADGRYVTFTSRADNLVPDDENGFEDAFVHDRLTGVTERMSVASDGSEATAPSFSYFARTTSVSGDGRYVVFMSEARNLVPGDTGLALDLFVRDRSAGTTERLSVGMGGAEANGQSNYPTITPDGRYVVFTSFADNLVPGDTNSTGDIFVADRNTGTIRRVSVAGDGTQGNTPVGSPPGGSISADGRFVTYTSAADTLVAGDTNGFYDIFLWDRNG